MGFNPQVAKVVAALNRSGNGDVAAVFIECGRKARYESLPDAMAHARRLAPKNGSFKMRVYQCSQCRDWHLSHQVGNAQPKPAQKKAVHEPCVPLKTHNLMVSQRDAAHREIDKLRKQLSEANTPLWRKLLKRIRA